MILIYFLIPVTGLKGYLCVLFFSTIFNATLSIHRLLKVAQVRLNLLDWIVKPILCGALSVLTASLLSKCIPSVFLPDWARSVGEVLFSGIGYYALLRLCGSLAKAICNGSKRSSSAKNQRQTPPPLLDRAFLQGFHHLAAELFQTSLGKGGLQPSLLHQFQERMVAAVLQKRKIPRKSRFLLRFASDQNSRATVWARQ